MVEQVGIDGCREKGDVTSGEQRCGGEGLGVNSLSEPPTCTYSVLDASECRRTARDPGVCWGLGAVRPTPPQVLQ